MRNLLLLSLLIAVPAQADIGMSEALTISCRNHFKTSLTKEATAFCACYPKSLLTNDNAKIIEESEGVMNQEIRMLMDDAGEKCLVGTTDKFKTMAREWIEE